MKTGAVYFFIDTHKDISSELTNTLVTKQNLQLNNNRIESLNVVQANKKTNASLLPIANNRDIEF